MGPRSHVPPQIFRLMVLAPPPRFHSTCHVSIQTYTKSLQAMLKLKKNLGIVQLLLIKSKLLSCMYGAKGVSSWAEPDFRFLRREVRIHFNTQTCTRRQKSGGTNQIAVSVAVARNTYLCLREAHYHPPVATGIRMAGEEFVGWRIAGVSPP